MRSNSADKYKAREALLGNREVLLINGETPKTSGYRVTRDRFHTIIKDTRNGKVIFDQELQIKQSYGVNPEKYIVYSIIDISTCIKIVGMWGSSFSLSWSETSSYFRQKKSGAKTFGSTIRGISDHIVSAGLVRHDEYEYDQLWLIIDDGSTVKNVEIGQFIRKGNYCIVDMVEENAPGEEDLAIPIRRTVIDVRDGNVPYVSERFRYEDYVTNIPNILWEEDKILILEQIKKKKQWKSYPSDETCSNVEYTAYASILDWNLEFIDKKLHKFKIVSEQFFMPT
jgi:hypothetical protein